MCVRCRWDASTRRAAVQEEVRSDCTTELLIMSDVMSDVSKAHYQSAVHEEFQTLRVSNLTCEINLSALPATNSCRFFIHNFYQLIHSLMWQQHCCIWINTVKVEHNVFLETWMWFSLLLIYTISSCGTLNPQFSNCTWPEASSAGFHVCISLDFLLDRVSVHDSLQQQNEMLQL